MRLLLGCGSAPNTVISNSFGVILSNSSIVRIPAMPLPITTNLVLWVVFWMLVMSFPQYKDAYLLTEQFTCQCAITPPLPQAGEGDLCGSHSHRVGCAHHACPERVEVVGRSPTYICFRIVQLRAMHASLRCGALNYGAYLMKPTTDRA